MSYLPHTNLRVAYKSTLLRMYAIDEERWTAVLAASLRLYMGIVQFQEIKETILNVS